MFLERLLDLVIAAWDRLTPIYEVKAWQHAGVLCFGRYRRTAGPGWHAKWPFAEVAYEFDTCTTTMRLPEQSLTTKDGKDVTVSAIVKYRIVDLRPYMCEILDQKDVLADSLAGAVALVVEENSWDDLLTGTPRKNVTTMVKRRTHKYGFEIEEVTLPDFCRARPLRVFYHPPSKDIDN